MLNQLRFICSPRHYKIISFFCRKGIREMNQMYEKVRFYNFSNFGGEVALSDPQ